MSTLTDFLHDLLDKGTELSIEDGKLVVEARAGALRPEAVQTLRQHKEEILRLLPGLRFEAPLSAGQEGLWYIQKSAPDSTAYNLTLAVRIEAEDDPRPALRRALQRLVNRHASLRTTYAAVEGSPRQIVHAYRAADLAEIDATRWSSAEVHSAAAAVHERPFDLEAEGVLRVRLFRIGPRESLLLLCVHHIAADGPSFRMLVDDLLRLYEADGRANPLPLVERTYQQFVCWQRDLLAARGDALRRGWLDELDGAPLVLNLPTDRPHPPSQTFHGAVRPFALAATLADGLRALARSQGTTLSTIFLAAFQVLLHRYSGQEDFCVGSVAALREHEELASTFGYMANLVALRAQIPADAPPDFLALLQQARRRVAAALDRADYPFPWLVKDLLTHRDPSRPPVVQVALDHQRAQSRGDAGLRLLNGEPVVIGGARFSPVLMPHETSEFELILQVNERPAGLDLAFRYNSDLFEPRTIDRMAGHLMTLLQEIVADPGRPITQLPLLSEAEREQQIVAWNRTQAPFSSEACIHQLFEAQVDRTPDAVALADLCGGAEGGQGATLTYRELDRRANQVAHHLVRLGVGPERLVGLHLPRSADLIVGLLGILKAGGAAVVLDPELPQRRLAFLLEDTGVPVLLTRASLLSGLPETRARVVDLDRGFTGEPAHRPASQVRPGNLAYVLFTSGTTGQPNGALIEHRGLVNSTEAHIRIMETGPGSRLAHVLSFNFDAAIAHLFDTICAGGALYLAPRDSDFLSRGFVALLQREAITHTALVPSMLAALPDVELPSLRTLVVGGEKCAAELVARWGRGRRMINVYGPTEASILATFALCIPDGNAPPIGRPIPNMQAYVVDHAGQLVPRGVVGELCLGGVGVARGYLKRPELTAHKFIDNPFGEGRLYRTGDLARYRVTDDDRPPVLEFLGRLDHQVKIRGHRVELSEVESALRASPRVRDAVVTVQETGEGASARLVAYVTPARRERSKEWELERVASWDRINAQVADKEPLQRELTLDIKGWKSSYTNEDIPPEEMRSWMESTVERILDLAPREVLEIGCGTGMLLARVAPRARRYRGTDLSRHAIEHVDLLKANLGGLDNVHVSQQPAHDFTGLSGDRFDTVILNSVVQYFPSIEYLLMVIEGVLGLIPDEGSIFIGDVRNLALLETYHASVERSRAGGPLPRWELRARVQRALINENELVIDPRFFTALRAKFPQIVDVEIAPKRFGYKNELSAFRYDVVLHIGAAPPAPAAPISIEWRDVSGEGLPLDEVRAWSARSGPGRALGLRGIPNARLREENALLRWLSCDNEDSREPVLPPRPDHGAWDPAALYALSHELPCRVAVSWAAARPDGSLDAIVTTGTLAPPPRFPLDPQTAPPSWAELANDPLQGKAHRELSTDLRRELGEALPQHLVPSAIVVLPALPLTLNGKVDLRALPAAVEDVAFDRAEPRTDVERKLAEVWRSVLGLSRVGIHDNFFELGGDSILSIQIVSRAQALGLSLRANQIFQHQTIAALAAATIGEVKQAEQEAVSGPVPLTPIQRWFLAQDLPAPSHFNQAVLLEIPATLDSEILRGALQHLQAHHDALRLRFERSGSAWTQQCLAAIDEVALEEVDLSSLAPEEQRAAMERTAARLQASLDISTGPLMRVAVLQLGGDQPGRLLWIIHHLAVDAVSWGVLIADLGMVCHQLAAGQAVELPPKTTSFKRWAERLLDDARGAAFEEERAILALDPSAPLPVDKPGGRNAKDAAAEIRVHLSEEETRHLLGDALRPYHLSVQELLLTALAQSVARWTGSPEVWIDLEGHGREDLFDDVDLSRTVGWFTSLFPVRLRLPGDDPAEALMAIKEQLRAVPRRGIGYGLLRYLSDEGAELRWPRPEISFNYLGRNSALGRGGGAVESPLELRFASESVGPCDASLGSRSHALQVNGLVAGGRLELSFGYSRDLHHAATIEQLAGDFIAGLGRLIRHCLTPGAGGWTPSDFPLVRLGGGDLRTLLERLGKDGRSKIEAIYPLTPVQRGILFHVLQDEADTMYTTRLVFRLQGPLDVAAFRSAWEDTLRRHPLLRSCFVWEGLSEPVQVLLREAQLPWEEHDLRGIADIEERLARFGAEHATRGIPLETAPLFRVALVRTDDQSYELFWLAHHILLDGWSGSVVMRHFFDAYGDRAEGRSPRAATPGSPYESYLRLLKRHDRKRSEAFWRNALRGLEAPTALPMDRRLPAGAPAHRVHLSRLGVELTAKLKAAAESKRVTQFTLLVGAWALLLGRYSGHDDVIFGTSMSGRDVDVPDMEDMVGLFINTLPVRVHIQEAEDVWTWLQALQAEQAALREHQHVPLVEIQRCSEIPAGAPLFESMLGLENYPFEQGALRGAGVVATIQSELSVTNYPLLVLALPGEELMFSFDYDASRFDAPSIARMAGHLTQILRGMVGAPSPRLGELSLLDDHERQRLLVSWNRTEAPFSSEACIHQLFEAHAERAPDAIAVVDLCGRAAGSQGSALTYGELDRRANQIAHRLRRLGVGPDTLVGVHLPRSADLVVALLGVLKAGGAFVVLDPDHPRRRLSFLLEDTRVAVVLSRASLRSTLPETPARVIDIDEVLEAEPAHRPESGVGPKDLAYVLYTSGTTGQPNGALIEHRGLVNAIETTARILEVGPGSRLAHVLSFNFDGALLKLFWMLCSGGAVYLAPRDGDFLSRGFIELVEREGITHTLLPPTMLAALPDAALPSLHTLVAGGESCSAELVARWSRGRRFFNMYGPTEVSIVATAARCTADGDPPPIGRPIANLQAYVVDREGQLTPAGVPGELCLGGVGVGRGYLNRPELTARKFIDNPFGEGRLYRTGDRVRYRMTEDGPPVLEFLGRLDKQVKIRGYRIELAEVENALRASPRVRDAVVTVHEGAQGEEVPRRLVAYVTPARQEQPEEWGLSQVASWRELYDQLEDEEPEEPEERELTLDLRGWKSSYTGDDIPPEEMRAWAESTVGRILDLAPREVLEIGCGTGMLLARVAPRAQRYRGTDFSRYAINHVKALKAKLGGLDNVHVSQQPAHDLTGLTGERFDTVIMNSVVQYFPSADYLFKVIEGLLGLMAERGAIFIGDVRNLTLLQAYHVSVERFRAGGSLPRKELHARVQRALINENELVIHPHFFTALRARFPQIVDVEIAPKRGAYKNELSAFRYDVTLRIGAAPPAPAQIEWRDVGAEGLTLDDVRAWIARSAPGRALGLRGIPNARVHDENALTRWLSGDDEDSREPRRPSHADPRVWDPEALYALAGELPCRVSLSWAAARPDGSLDAIVTTGAAGPAPSFPLDPPAEPASWADLANDPLQSKAYRELAVDLRRELGEALPQHMVPSAIVVLPALPLTLNGKVDLRALPPPAAQEGASSEQAEPRTDAERKLAEVWCSVLGLSRIGIHDNFFELGGDSILSIQLVSRAQALGLSLRANQIFEHPTIAELAAAAGGEARQAEQGTVSGPVPLTPIQRWFLAQDLPAPSHFNQAVLLEIPSDLDPEIMRRALLHLQAHHDALRLRFERSGSGWTQECLASVDDVALEEVDLSSLAPEEQRAVMERTAARLQASLDISSGPLMRVAIFRLGGGQPGRLLWIIHHLAIDAVSWGVLLPDLGTAYQQLAAWQAVELPPRTTSFKRWAERLLEHARSAAFEEERVLLAFDPPAPLPVDLPGGRNVKDSAAEVRVRLSEEETRLLIGDALRPYNLGVQELLLTALTQSVARWTGAPEVWIDLEGHGREDLFDDVDLSRTVGWFTSLFPVRLCLPGDDPAEALMAIKEQVRAVPRRGIGYGLLRYLSDEGAELRWPSPEISFNYLGRNGALGRTGGAVESPLELRFAPESVGPCDASSGPRSHALQVNALVAEGRLELSFVYSRDLHHAATVERLARDFLAALGRLIRHCLSPGAGGWTPSDFPLVRLGQRELRALLDRLGERGRSTIESIYPLTPVQRGLLFHALYAEADAAYLMQSVLRLEGALDAAALRSAWQDTLRRHPLLRSCFVWEGLSEPVQVVLREPQLPWEEHDIRGVAEREVRLARLGDELSARGLPLGSAPLMRLSLVRTGDQSYALLWLTHHILLDGWSAFLIQRDAFAAYAALAQGKPPRVITTGVPYDGYIRLLKRQDRERSEAFWRRALRGFEAPTPLVVERSRPTGERGHRSHVIRLGAELTSRLTAAAKAERVTLHALLEGAWALLLSRYSGHDDVLFGETLWGRDVGVPGIEEMVGLFVNTLPVRVRVDDAEGVWTWLRAIQAEQAEAREHQHTPLVEIQRCSAVPAGTQLFDSLLVFQKLPFDQRTLSGPGVAVTPRIVTSTHYSLTVHVVAGEELQIDLEYEVSRFDPRTIARVAGHLAQLLRGMVDAPASRLGELPLLDDEERRQILVEWNRTAEEHNRESSIHALFEAQVARTPDATAVFFDDRVISYAELNRRANRLARRLQRMGVGPETRVAVCVDRSDEMIVSLLAVLKSGGAYVPIDPAYPLARQKLIAEDSGADLIVTRSELGDALASAHVRLVALDADAEGIAAEGDTDLRVTVSGDRLAYLLYTSGSTGKPKAVAIEHRSAVALLHWARTEYSAEDLRGVLASTSICFDLSVFEIFLPLSTGGAVVVAENALALSGLPARDRVTLINTVPSAMAELLRFGSLPSGVRVVNLAGERLGNDLVQRVHREPRVQRVYNLYGPSECTTYSTFALMQRGASDEPAIGRPIANTKAYILDAHLRPVPVGVPGELYLGGEGLARCYFNRPDLTATRFITDPFGAGRLYRTGDRARFAADGEIEFLGRLDHQVKLRGFRIELGEIEAALERLPEVERAVVVVQGQPPQERLVAYWVAAPGQVIDVEALRAQLAGALPAFMVPEVYLRLDALPLTSTGKVDRGALPAPGDTALHRGQHRAPETPVERALAAIWSEVLGVERVGAHDDFFRIGGNSLLALTMMTRVEAELGRRVSLAALFRAPTLEALARTVAGPVADPLLTRIQPGGDRPPLFWFTGLGGHIAYLHDLEQKIGADQPLYGIQAIDLEAEMPDVERMEVLAARVADTIQKVQPAGPYILCGHSLGALVALSVVVELEARGHRTTLVVIDMAAPRTEEHRSRGQHKQLLGYVRLWKGLLGSRLEVDMNELKQLSEDDAWPYVLERLQRIRFLPQGAGVELLQRVVRSNERLERVMFDYMPGAQVQGRLVLLKAADVDDRSGVTPEGWQDICVRPVTTFTVPGNHVTLVLDPNVEVIVEKLRQIVDESQTPADDPFPVQWDDPEEAKAFWMFDETHSGKQMGPLDFELRLSPMIEAGNRVNAFYGTPLGSQPKLIHGFVYLKGIVADLPADEIASAMRQADAAVRRDMSELGDRWETTWLPEIRQHLAELDAFDLRGAELPALLAHLLGLKDRLTRLWEIHNRVLTPAMLGISDFEDAYRDLFPDAKPIEAYDLLAGFPNKTVEANLRLWEIGRAVARDPSLRAHLVERAPSELPAALAETPEGRALWSEILDYLRVYGERNDSLNIDAPTWIDDPTPVLLGLREAVLNPDRDLAAELQRQARRRESRLAEVRSQLASYPRAVVEEFEALLRMAQVGTVLSEDHNFWLDCKITHHARRVCLEVGRRLSERGVLEGPDDVLFLKLAEISTLGDAPEASSTRLRAVIAERRADAARFAGVKPPPMLGVLPASMPMDSAIMKTSFKVSGNFMALPAEAGELRGMPGSSGKVTGPARVVRTLDEAHKLQPGDVLVAPATLPSWTPFFASVAAVVTNHGGVLCHAAVVAREYGIPAVVGARSATEALTDGQLVEVDGDTGVVRALAQ